MRGLLKRRVIYYKWVHFHIIVVTWIIIRFNHFCFLVARSSTVEALFISYGYSAIASVFICLELRNRQDIQITYIIYFEHIHWDTYYRIFRQRRENKRCWQCRRVEHTIFSLDNISCDSFTIFGLACRIYPNYLSGTLDTLSHLKVSQLLVFLRKLPPDYRILVKILSPRGKSLRAETDVKGVVLPV